MLSCEHYLEVKSNKSLVVPENLADLQALLDASTYMNVNICSFGEVSSDDYFLRQTTYNGMREELRKAYTWDYYAYNYSNDWSKSYYTVYVSNLVLERLQKIDRNVTNAHQWDEVCGAALFFRANQYLSLLWTFAKVYDSESKNDDLGIVIRKTSNLNDLSKRSTIAECYNEVLTDLKMAMELLPKESSHPMRPSAIGAYGVLARSYLSMGNIDSAYYYSNRLLEMNSDLLNYNDSKDVNLTANYPISRFNKETLTYFELTVASQLSTNNAMMDSLLYKSYSNNDLRKIGYFKQISGDNYSFRGSFSGGTRQFGGMTTAEALLIRAECLARLNHLVKAQQDINLLLENRYLKGTFVSYNLTDKNQVLDLILSERRKELVFRGLRWIDLKRYNLEGKNIYIKRIIDNKEIVLAPHANRYALPLPYDIVSSTGIVQNPI